MTRKRKGKNRKGFVAIPFTGALALAILADETVIKNSIINAFGEDIYCISLDIALGLRGHTASETPLYFGVCHGDLSNTEVLESIISGLIDPDDIIQKERARRPVRKIGGFQGIGAEPVFNDGKKYRQVMKFSVGDTHTVDFWVKNQSGAALTTGTIVEYDGVLYGRWQR